MDIGQTLTIITRQLGPPALGVYGAYKIRKIRKLTNEKRIMDSSLLNASGMGMDEVDIGRALRLLSSRGGHLNILILKAMKTLDC